jgi:excisionase family DNA binding protein
MSRSEMKGVDPRISQLFHHLREAIDILEQISLRQSRTPDQSLHVKPEQSAPPPPPTLDPAKLAYSVKELGKLLGISRSKVYQAMKNGELRAVKYGKKTLIMAKDLQVWVDAWPERR